MTTIQEIKFVHNMSAQDIIDEVKWEERQKEGWHTCYRYSIIPQVERKLIERIAWRSE